MTEATQTQAQAQSESDINTLKHFDDNEDIDVGNFEKNANDAPPPIPMGDYKLRFELGDADPDKAIWRSQSDRFNFGKTFIVYRLVGTIIEPLDDSVPVESVHNRKVFILENSGVRNKGDASKLSDFLKCIGVGEDEVPTKFNDFKAWFVELLAAGPTGNVRLDWQASGKDEQESDTKKQYVEPRMYNSMLKFPQDDEGGYVPEIEYENKATGSRLTLRAKVQVVNYYPAS